MESLKLIGFETTNSEVSFSSFWFPSKCRARARKSHKFSEHGCLVRLSNVRQLILWFSSRVCVNQCFFNPFSGPRKMLQKWLDLPVCRTSNLWLSFFYYTNRWHHLCWQDRLVLPNRLWCTQNSIGPAEFYFRVPTSSRIFHLLCFPFWAQMRDSHLLPNLTCWKSDACSCCPILLLWGPPFHKWRLCLSSFQVQNLWRNAYMSATLHQVSYPQIPR